MFFISFLSEKTGEGNSACYSAHLSLGGLFDLLYALVYSADDKILKSLNIVLVNDGDTVTLTVTTDKGTIIPVSGLK